MAELITWLFTSRLANLKLLQLLCSIITILFLIDGRLQWGIYTVIFITTIILSVLTFLTLVVYFLRLQNQSGLPWIHIEILFNAAAAILCFIFAAILIYDYAKMAGGEFRHHKHLPPATIGQDGWRNRVLVIVFVQILNAIFYFVSLYRTKALGLK
ncbi:hypothetical protein M3Y97_00882500 [Aphelenchoides bicaudatus]|nr:hypothetical protein M3Y97_00882500 [Aphelenchoides bicaudatus]